MNRDGVEAYWQRFVKETDRDPSTRYYECFAFGAGSRMADELLALVLQGKKRATTSSLRAYEASGERLPRVGDFSIVLDGAGEPRCIIETAAVVTLPFDQMTFDICKREGEDECLETWVEGHRRFFSQEAEAHGYAFSEDMPVVFEDFCVIFPPEVASEG